MIQEVYDWLESRTGSPYDFRDEIAELDIADAFLTPIDWYNTVTITIDRLEDCVEDINHYKYEIPEDLPDAEDMKKEIISETTGLLLDKLDKVKERIGIKPVNVVNAYDMIRHFSMISKVIDICKKSTTENIISKLSKFEEDNDFFLADTFDITDVDYPQLYSDIIDIVEEYQEEDE